MHLIKWLQRLYEKVPEDDDLIAFKKRREKRSVFGPIQKGIVVPKKVVKSERRKLGR